MIQGLNGIIYYLHCTHYFLPLLEVYVHFLTSNYSHINLQWWSLLNLNALKMHSICQVKVREKKKKKLLRSYLSLEIKKEKCRLALLSILKTKQWNQSNTSLMKSIWCVGAHFLIFHEVWSSSPWLCDVQVIPLVSHGGQRGVLRLAPVPVSSKLCDLREFTLLL